VAAGQVLALHIYFKKKKKKKCVRAACARRARGLRAQAPINLLKK
jgi:hypothetical protein